MALCDVQAGDLAEVIIELKEGEETNLAVEAAILDETAFRKCYEVLSECTLQLTSFSSDRLEGTIDCNRDGLLYTSIPQNGNWRVSVDGKETDSVLLGDCMLCVPMTQGFHTVSFSYINSAFYTGLSVSLLSLAIFLTVTFYNSRRKHVS